MRLLMFLLILPTIDPAPKLRGGAFGTQRPMPYGTAMIILLLIVLIVVRFLTLPHGTGSNEY